MARVGGPGQRRVCPIHEAGPVVAHANPPTVNPRHHHTIDRAPWPRVTGDPSTGPMGMG